MREESNAHQSEMAGGFLMFIFRRKYEEAVIFSCLVVQPVQGL